MFNKKVHEMRKNYQQATKQGTQVNKLKNEDSPLIKKQIEQQMEKFNDEPKNTKFKLDLQCSIATNRMKRIILLQSKRHVHNHHGDQTICFEKHDDHGDALDHELFKDPYFNRDMFDPIRTKLRLLPIEKIPKMTKEYLFVQAEKHSVLQ